MIQRCTNPNNDGWKNYGGRGIRVCDRWLNSFEAYLEDVGECPSPKHSLDRYPNNNGNYEPGNVRWATAKQQLNNRRNSVVVEFNGERMTVTEWSEKLGWPMHILRNRIDAGWDGDRAITTPPGRVPPRMISYGGETKSVSAWARSLGVSPKLIQARLQALGWSPEEVLGFKERTDPMIRHGHTGKTWQSPEYRSWHLMKDSCNREKSTQWPRYGGRGIKVCERWSLFDNFFADLGTRPDGHSLRLIDENADFAPGNAEWRQSFERMHGKRSHLVTFAGETLSVSQWSRRTGLPFNTIKYRLERGIAPEVALSSPPRSSACR